MKTPSKMVAGAKKMEARREAPPKKETTGVLERIAKPTLSPQREHEFSKTTFSARQMWRRQPRHSGMCVEPAQKNIPC